jgi:G3E family GTPase
MLMEMEVTDGKGVMEKRMVPKPETLEYGISSFVYSARRPFHPKRLWETVSAPFCVIQTQYEGEDEEDGEEDGEAEAVSDDEEDHGEDGKEAGVKGEGDDKAADVDPEQQKLEDLAEVEAQKAALDLPARAKFKRGSPVWKGVLRSKGFIWLATRPHVHGEWSQAGVSGSIRRRWGH